MPESVPAYDITMVKNAIMQVLQRIFSLELYIAEYQVCGVQHKVITLYSAVFHHEAAAEPAEFV